MFNKMIVITLHICVGDNADTLTNLLLNEFELRIVTVINDTKYLYLNENIEFGLLTIWWFLYQQVSLYFDTNECRTYEYKALASDMPHIADWPSREKDVTVISVWNTAFVIFSNLLSTSHYHLCHEYLSGISLLRLWISHVQ